MDERPDVESLVEEFLAARRAGSATGARAFAAAHPGAGPGLVDALESAVRAVQGPDPTPAPAELDGCERLAGFVLERELGRGGMGVVWQAREETLDRRVALKLLPPDLLHDPVLRQRFQREAALTARLSHPAICAVLGVDLEGPRPWIAMALVEGESLAQRIARTRAEGARWIELGASAPGRAGPLAVAAWFAGVAHVLEHAHALGVVHRDVKPSNLMIDRRGAPVLVDFGLARAEDRCWSTSASRARRRGMRA